MWHSCRVSLSNHRIVCGNWNPPKTYTGCGLVRETKGDERAGVHAWSPMSREDVTGWSPPPKIHMNRGNRRLTEPVKKTR